ncbi:MAG: ribonuclease P protein component [Emcibacteraceae bacterium]|nr:ribonuclease P protein component [Emcibacteraceae bacterium]
MMQVTEDNTLNIETLKKRSDFLRVASVRKKWVTPAMIIQVAPRVSDAKDDLQVGYTASKKVGNAVARSRAKRLMREVVQNCFGSCASQNHDYVIIARQEILTYAFDQLIRDLKWALKRLHVTSKDKKEGA